MFFKKYLRKLKSNSYLKYCNLPIKEKYILLEAGQGKNLNGNMFALIRELCENPAYSDYTVAFVVTDDTLESAKERFLFYGYTVELVIRDSEKYKEYLATCKTLCTDNSFPPYFLKRKEQVYLNTWHGTPLKTLGVSDLKNAKSLANIQKNYLMCDYALFPNEFCKDVFMDDYMLRNIYKGKILLQDYPRNSIFLDDDAAKKLRDKLGLNNKQIIAYMPTWRGTGRNADTDIQKRILDKYFTEIDKRLNDDQIFYVNLHFLIGNTMDFQKYKHIKPFPKEYETYDFLAICDCLVTDYSSVFFDYAVTKRKIILFAYDLYEYMRDRGTYFPIEDLPFPIVDTVDQLINEINDEKYNDYSEFLSTYCSYADLHTSKKVLDLLLKNDNSEVNLSNATDNEKDIILVYGGKLKSKHKNEMLADFLSDISEKNSNSEVLLTFRGGITSAKVNFLEELPKDVRYLALVNKYEFTLVDKIKAAFGVRYKISKEKNPYFLREKNRLFYSISPAKVIDFYATPDYMYRILSHFDCEKEIHIHHMNLDGVNAAHRKYKILKQYAQNNYDEIVDHTSEDVHRLWNEEENVYYNLCFKAGSLFKHFSNTKNGMKCSMITLCDTCLPFSMDKLSIQVGKHMVPSKVTNGFALSKSLRIIRISFTIPYDLLKEVEIQNKINLVYTDQDGYGLCKGIKYSLFNLRKGKNKNGPIYIDEESQTSSDFRQTVNNVLYLTVRNLNISDKKSVQFKMNLAYFLSKIVPYKKVILLFEKESSRYEESASVLYEKLIDQGYKNCYFILDKNYSHFNEIKPPYTNNLIYKGSFKHYFMFFKSKTFLGSEALVHSVDLRVANKHALKKLAQKDIDYVFLQHGVMYMVSLDSESRTFFKPKKTIGKFRVVVSSKEEARHFTELGNYDPETIYISGLPKYDRNVLNEDANKITIMPTWRPWEYNEARFDFLSTKYYKMIERIFNSIPKELHKNVVILPHPLFWNAVKDADFPLRMYLNVDSKYDDILKETKVFITDYSSIAYDAFYRGSNVIFYWEEKDECMENYGPSTKLMLNESNAFGDICMNTDDLGKVFQSNYENGQKEIYKKNYKNIVQFHDGKNTERLIEMMKKEEII